MTKRLLFLLTALSLASVSCSSLAVAAATVDGEKITESEVESELNTLRQDPIFGEALKRDPDTRGQRRRQILQELIYQAVAEEEARRLGVRVTDQQADRLIEQAARARGASPDQFLENENLSRGAARRVAARQVRRFALIEKVVKDIDIDRKEIRDVYEGQQDRFIEVRLERITVKDEATAREVLEAVGSGEGFADVARQRSIDPLADNGGDMGTLPFTELDVQVQGAVGGAVEGGLTDPIEGDNGFEIYRLVDRRTKSFAEVAGDIEQALAQERADSVFNDWLADKVRDAKIVVNPKYGRFDKRADPPSVQPSTSELDP